MRLRNACRLGRARELIDAEYLQRLKEGRKGDDEMRVVGRVRRIVVSISCSDWAIERVCSEKRFIEECKPLYYPALFHRKSDPIRSYLDNGPSCESNTMEQSVEVVRIAGHGREDRRSVCHRETLCTDNTPEVVRTPRIELFDSGRCAN